MTAQAVPVDIAHIIELAIAPVFLIAGIGALLNVLTSRLGRVVDRGRLLETAIGAEPTGAAHDRIAKELLAVDQRMKRIHVALILSTLAALLNCLVIMFLFTGELFGVDLSRLVATAFIATMAAMIGALCFFLGEIGIATRTLRVRTELLDRQPRRRATDKK